MFQHNLFPRRRLLKLSLGTFACFGAVSTSKTISFNRQLQALNNPSRDFTIAEYRPLKECAQEKGLVYGASALHDELIFDSEFADRFVQESDMLVPGWEFKWSAGDKLLRPGPDEFDFSAVDRMVDFAQKHKLLLRGHTLVWHESLPQWFSDYANHHNARKLMTHHIETLVSRYAGQIHSWDVVNEAIAYEPEKCKRTDCLRLTPWLEFLGPDFIDLAFRTAAAADPKAMLVYNDFDLVYDTPRDRAKRAAVLNLLRRLKAKGTPIHALGLQAHLRGDSTDFDPQKLRSFLKEVADLDLKILVTEMDVKDTDLPADIKIRDRIVAGAYEDYLSVVLEEPAVIAVVTWGLSDRYTFHSEFNPRSDGKSVRPLLLDANLSPKLAWNAMVRAFSSAPPR